MNGTLPVKWKTEKWFLSECPIIKNSRLKKQSKRKALNISGDLVDPLSPILE
jgi:hypothetical protein